MFTHKGYVYQPWEDREPDNVKIFHDVISLDDDKARLHMPLSPYSKPDAETFHMWIDSGMPSRQELNRILGTNGNASCKDIKKYYQQWLDDKIDDEILGGQGD